MNTVTDLRAPEVLRRAREALIWCGWTQGDFVNQQGEICADGALRYAITGRPDTLRQDMTGGQYAAPYAVQDLLAQVIGGLDLRPDDNWALPEWNDALGRTKDEVLAALIKAERQARAAETPASS